MPWHRQRAKPAGANEWSSWEPAGTWNGHTGGQAGRRGWQARGEWGGGQAGDEDWGRTDAVWLDDTDTTGGVWYEPLGEPLEGEGLFTRESLRWEYSRSKNGRAVPPGCCAKEVWQMVVQHCPELGKAVVLSLNNMHRLGRVPRCCNLSFTFQLGKNNGKQGCAGILLINLLSPDGKVFYRRLWRRARPIRLPWAYGFYSGRRREQAIVVQSTTGWRLRQLSVGHTVTLHDVANAFPSPSHDCIDSMVDSCAWESDRPFLKHRYGNTCMVVTSRCGDGVTVRPRTGGLQGDAAMAPMFSTAYDQHAEGRS